MTFIPKEVQDKLKHQEEEIQRLKESLHITESQVKETPNGFVKFLPWLIAIISIAFAAFLYFNQPEPVEKSPEYLDLLGQMQPLDNVGSEMAFYVQIGAFEKFSFKGDPAQIENIYQIKNDSLQKVLLGKFPTFAQAQAFQYQVLQLGIENAYIVVYKDGGLLGLMEGVHLDLENQNED